MQPEGQGGSASARVQLQGVLCARRAGRRARANVANGFAHPLHVRGGGGAHKHRRHVVRVPKEGVAARLVAASLRAQGAACGARLVEGGRHGVHWWHHRRHDLRADAARRARPARARRTGRAHGNRRQGVVAAHALPLHEYLVALPEYRLVADTLLVSQEYCDMEYVMLHLIFSLPHA